MNILLTGATGLIATSIGARLGAEGHSIVGAVRPGGAEDPPAWMARRVEIDAAEASAKDWEQALEGIDAVINCIGALQGSRMSGDLGAVHVAGADALFAACEASGVRRVIHFSAIGVDRHQLSRFSSTKLKGEKALTQRDLDWVILRPSVVLGRPVYGASAQFRGLSALPVTLQIPDAGPLQVVQLSDVVETVVAIVNRPEISRRAFDLAGPDRLPFDDVVRLYRRWHGWRPAPRLAVPALLLRAAFAAGDFLGNLGWRPALRSNAERELLAGAVSDNEDWRKTFGFEPRGLEAALAAEPVTVQDRWFARLFFLKPLGLIVFVLFWVGTGLISIGPGYEIGVETMLAGGAGRWSGPVVIAGGLADIVVGLLIAFRRTARLGLIAALVVSLAYAVIGTAILPSLWIEPLGPMLKIWPIIVLNLFLLATLSDR